MKNIWTIFKKEWDRVMKDKRLILTVILLPGLMLFLIYSFIGNATSNIGNNDIRVAIVNPQDDFTAIYTQYEDLTKTTVVKAEKSEIISYEKQIDNKEWTLLIVFGDTMATYQKDDPVKPNVTLYSNPNDLDSSTAASRFANYLNAYQSVLSYDLYGNTDYFNFVQAGTPVSNEGGGIAGTLISSLLPMLVVMFLFSGAMQVGPEAIAGEKERGTIATLLVTPVKRSEIAFGKVIGLSVLSLLSAISSFIGISFSLPKLLNLDSSIAINYAFKDYLMIFVLLITTVFVIVGLISIISAYAKSLKEANSFIAPLYILTILVSVTTMFSSGANTNILMYLIPIYNTVQTMISILLNDPNAFRYLIVTASANIAYVLFFIYVLNKMFKSEKIMFTK